MVATEDKWLEVTDEESGKFYYYNEVTRVSSWVPPHGAKPENLPLTHDSIPPLPVPFAEDSLVWVPDEEDVCQPATVVGSFCPGERGSIKFDGEPEATELSQEETAALQQMEPQVLKPEVDDMITLDQLIEFSILHKLRLRFADDEIYTNVSSVLISVNPFKRIPIFQDELLQDYLHPSPVKEYKPHIFAVSQRAYAGMLESKKSQSILVSGESGAGKTEATKYLLKFLAEASKSAEGEHGAIAAAGQADGRPGLETQILQASPPLEAFGNAKTTRNNNSSRFGKLMSVQFDPMGRVMGAAITNYLLEKSRIVAQTHAERNYHMFYMVLAGMAAHPEIQNATLGDMKTQMDHNFLDKPKPTPITGPAPDLELFEECSEAMDMLGIGVEEKNSLYSILSVVLLLGNVEFGQVTNADASQTTSVADSHKDTLEKCAKVLGVQAELLEKALCYRKTGARGSVYYVPNTIVEAGLARDAMTKMVYSQCFDWLIVKINLSLASDSPAEGSDPASETHIRVLDIFGFETFETNSFEQICINYCNEKLHNFFNKYIFKLEQDEYERQEIQVPTIEFQDNQPCLDLLDAKSGVFAMIDEENRMVGGTDDGLLSKIYKAHDKNDHLTKTHIKVKNARRCFSIEHFAGRVPYDTAGFLDKNMDSVPEDVAAVLGSSEDSFTALVIAVGSPSKEELAAEAEKAASSGGRPKGGSGGKKKQLTLGAKFKAQLASLMDTLGKTDPHFVRCIKPNDQQKPQIFEAPKVQFQLRCNGLMEVCQIRQVGYPVRLGFEDFYAKYKHLGPDDGSITDTDSLCVHLNSLGALQRDQWAKGKSKIFLRVRSCFRLDHWEEICAAAVANLVQWGHCAAAIAKLRRCKRLLAELAQAVTEHDLPKTEAGLALCAEQLPYGGGHTKSVEHANSMLPQLRAEHVLREALTAAVQSRDMPTLQAAVAAAEAVKEQTMDACPQMANARRMIELLQREGDLKAGLARSTADFDREGVAKLLAEATELQLECAEVEGAKKFQEDVEAALAALLAAAEEAEINILTAAIAAAEALKLNDTDEYAEASEACGSILEVKKGLADALARRDRDAVEEMLQAADDINLECTEVEQCQAFVERVVAVRNQLLAALKAGDIELLDAATSAADAEGLQETKEYKDANKVRVRINDIKRALTESVKTKNKARLTKLLEEAEELGLGFQEVVEARACKLLIEIAAAVKRNSLEDLDSLIEIADQSDVLSIFPAASDEMTAAKLCQRKLQLQVSLLECIDVVSSQRSEVADDDGVGADDGEDPVARLTKLIAEAEGIGLQCGEVAKAKETITLLEGEGSFLESVQQATESQKLADLAAVLLSLENMPSLAEHAAVKAAQTLFASLMEEYIKGSSGMEGTVQKLGEKRRTYKKRWLTLRNMELQYYENAKSKKAKGAIPLSTVKRVVTGTDEPLIFKLVTPVRTWVFKCESEQSMKEWSAEIRSCALASHLMATEEKTTKWERFNSKPKANVKANAKQQLESKVISIDTVGDMRQNKTNIKDDIAKELKIVQRLAGRKQDEDVDQDELQEHVKVQGTLFTGDLMVKQDLETYENLYKPLDWKPYYFVLGKAAMYLFADSSCQKLLGWVLITPDSTVYPTSLGPFSFQVVTPYLVAHMDSESEKSTLEWIHSISKVIRDSGQEHMPVAITRAARKIALEQHMYNVEYNERRPLGMKLKPKTKFWAVVTASKRDSGITVGSVLAKVDDKKVEEVGYHSIVSLLKNWAPPMVLSFRSAPTGGGFLQELTPTSKKWKMRYFSVEAGALQMYSTEESGNHSSDPAKAYNVAILKSFLDLEGAVLRVLPRSEIGRDFCFQLVGGTGKTVMQARDEEDMIDWCSMLFYATSMANGGHFVLNSLQNADEAKGQEEQEKQAAQKRAVQMLGSGTTARNLMEGMLSKQSMAISKKRRIRNWNKRYFVLCVEGNNQCTLSYYTSKDLASRKGGFDINKNMRVAMNEAVTKPHCFQLNDNTTEIIMQAASDDERDQWIKAITEAVNMAKQSGGAKAQVSKVKAVRVQRGSQFSFDVNTQDMIKKEKIDDAKKNSVADLPSMGAIADDDGAGGEGE
jgi:myosin heavy subunit